MPPVSPTTPNKVPPTGPKSLRNGAPSYKSPSSLPGSSNFSGLAGASSSKALRDRISFALPSTSASSSSSSIEATGIPSSSSGKALLARISRPVDLDRNARDDPPHLSGKSRPGDRASPNGESSRASTSRHDLPGRPSSSSKRADDDRDYDDCRHSKYHDDPRDSRSSRADLEPRDSRQSARRLDDERYRDDSYRDSRRSFDRSGTDKYEDEDNHRRQSHQKDSFHRSRREQTRSPEKYGSRDSDRRGETDRRSETDRRGEKERSSGMNGDTSRPSRHRRRSISASSASLSESESPVRKPRRPSPVKSRMPHKQKEQSTRYAESIDPRPPSPSPPLPEQDVAKTTVRAPISFAIPNLPAKPPNAISRARPPHLDAFRPPSPPPLTTTDSSRPSSPSHPPPDDSDRPPSPPGSPPLDDSHPPSPSSRLPASSPPRSPSSPPPLPSPPLLPRNQDSLIHPLPPALSDHPDNPSAPPPTSDVSSSPRSVIPPAFHFRDLPINRIQDEDTSSGKAETPERSRPETPVEVSRPRTPLPPPPTPPCASRRPGVGNYVVLHDPAVHTSKKGKELVKRLDGEMDGKVIELVDPRLAMSAESRRRGRGSSKSRIELYELEYAWDGSSRGTKPPVPPAAVLFTGLNALTTVEQISKHLRPYGRIREIDSKMDTRTGMQLGICWVKFEGPASGRPGTAHDVANQVVKGCAGQRIGLSGDEKITVVLDGRGLRAEKAVKEEMIRRYQPKKPAPQPASTPSVSAPTPRSVPTPQPHATPSSGHATPRLDAPSSSVKPSPPVPRAIPFHTSLPNRPRPPTIDRRFPPPPPPRPYNAPYSRAPAYPARPSSYSQNISSSFIDAPFDDRDRDRDRDRHRDGGYPRYGHRPRSRSRSRSRSRGRTRRERSHSCSTCSYSSDSEDDRYKSRRNAISPRRHGYRGRAVRKDSVNRKEDEAAQERINKALESNGHAYVYIETTALPAKSVSEDHLKDHFRAFKASQILTSTQAWYILFSDDHSAQRAKILDNTIVQGHRLVIQVRTPQAGTALTAPLSASTADNLAVGKGAWRYLTIGKKNRPAKPVVQAHRSPSPSTSISSARRLRRPSPSSSSELSEEEVSTTRTKVGRETPDSDEEVSTVVPTISDTATPISDEIRLDDAPPKGKKRPAKAKTTKAAKRARIMSSLEDIEPVSTPEVAEIILDETAPTPEATATVPKPKPAKAAKPKKPARTAVDDIFASGIVADEEDAYWLGQALAAAHDGVAADLSDEEAIPLDELGNEMTDKHPLHHTSGSWRAEGYKKIPQIAKSVYLPQRNRAQVSVEDTTAMTSGRSARVTGRRLALEMETTRKTTIAATAESDLFAFNQLRIRKKQLRFARSAIEGYGLYAMETIHVGEMVCEYVGEICRSAVAEIREQRYLKQGIGSSYLFRIDADAICDATFRGSVSRLINHSCDPSASAKIISINGQSKIVIYAKRTLHPGEEILYDYKFPLESDPALRVPCLCGAATCRGWLN